MPRYSQDPRTFPQVCHKLLEGIKETNSINFVFHFKTGREADRFKALVNAYRNAWRAYAQVLRKQRDFSESASADDNYVLIASCSIQLEPSRSLFTKEKWAVTPITVRIVSKNEVEVYSNAMDQLTQQLPTPVQPSPSSPSPSESEHRLTTEEELEAFQSAPLVALEDLVFDSIPSPTDPYATFKFEDD